jgi:hypothetical protein
VVCYIYFTRIIVYLLESTLPFQYIWMANAASELATLAFYVASGISFRRARCPARSWSPSCCGAGSLSCLLYRRGMGACTCCLGGHGAATRSSREGGGLASAGY